MPSLMLKSIITIAAFLAAIGRVWGEEVVDGNWDIQYQSVNADATARGRVNLDYHIGADRLYSVDVFERDCATAVTGAPVSISRTMKVTPEGTHDGLHITLDLDESAIASRNVWEGSRLQFCVKIRLLSMGSLDGEEQVIKEE
jgi:hypothetical protein